MKKTIEEVNQLKEQWKNDPCWDLYTTEGFEDYAEELKAFQEQCEREWEEKRAQREKELDEEADRLGVRGLFRLISSHQVLLDRHGKAIELLADGKSYEAYKVLLGQ